MHFPPKFCLDGASADMQEFSDRVLEIQRLMKESAVLVADDADPDEVAEAKQKLRDFINWPENVAFLLCEYCKIVRFLLNEHGMYKKVV